MILANRLKKKMEFGKRAGCPITNDYRPS